MSERVFMMDCGDGVRRADNGCIGKTVAAKTASFTLTKYDTGKMYTNRGASGAIVATLPSAVKNIWYAFGKPTAQTFTITATGGAKIDGGSANGSITVPAGGLVMIVSDGTDWYSKVTLDSVALASIAQGTDGQLLVGQTGASVLYKTVTGDITITANGVTAIGADKVLSSMVSEKLVKYAEVAISAVAIIGTDAGQLGHANGVVLVAAPGATKVLELISAVLIYDYDTAAYTDGGNLTINIGGGGAALTGLISAANSVGAAADKIVQFNPLAAAAANLTANTGLNLVASAAFTNPGTAAGVIRVKIAYRTHTHELA